MQNIILPHKIRIRINLLIVFKTNYKKTENINLKTLSMSKMNTKKLNENFNDVVQYLFV